MPRKSLRDPVQRRYEHAYASPLPDYSFLSLPSPPLGGFRGSPEAASPDPYPKFWVMKDLNFPTQFFDVSMPQRSVNASSASS